jgi:GTPase SAR1 family protein
MYYRQAVAAVAVCDLTNPQTLDALPRWIEAFRENGEDRFVVIAGNKADLADGRKISPEDLAAAARDCDAECVETSAETGAGVEEVFDIIARRIAKRAMRTPAPGLEESGDQPCPC